MRSAAPCYDELKAFIDATPLVDCHDHSAECGPRLDDPILAIITGYVTSDLTSASSDEDAARMQDVSLSLEERWPALERAFEAAAAGGAPSGDPAPRATFFRSAALSCLRPDFSSFLTSSPP